MTVIIPRLLFFPTWRNALGRGPGATYVVIGKYLQVASTISMSIHDVLGRRYVFNIDSMSVSRALLGSVCHRVVAVDVKRDACQWIKIGTE